MRAEYTISDDWAAGQRVPYPMHLRGYGGAPPSDDAMMALIHLLARRRHESYKELGVQLRAQPQLHARSSVDSLKAPALLPSLEVAMRRMIAITGEQRRQDKPCTVKEVLQVACPFLRRIELRATRPPRQSVCTGSSTADQDGNALNGGLLAEHLPLLDALLRRRT